MALLKLDQLKTLHCNLAIIVAQIPAQIHDTIMSLLQLRNTAFWIDVTVITTFNLIKQIMYANVQLLKFYYEVFKLIIKLVI